MLEAGVESFARVLTRENHTLKRALTDPRLFSGIGNAYSDEILQAARLSPLKQTAALRTDEIEQLYRLVPRVHDALHRRVQVAKVFMAETPVAVLEEFATGMDPILKRSFMDRLRRGLVAAGRSC